MIWHTEPRAMKTVGAGAAGADCGEANLTHCGPCGLACNSFAGETCPADRNREPIASLCPQAPPTAAAQAESMQDAELYLSSLGIPRGLPQLYVQYEGTAIPIRPASEFQRSVDQFLQRAPVVSWNAEGTSRYTLLMVDPDAPDREGDGSRAAQFGPWLHWLVVDCAGDAASGVTKQAYMGPAPPKGKHRYLLLLFEQTAGTPAVASVDRMRWDIAGFLKNPVKPVAATFFYCSAQ